MRIPSLTVVLKAHGDATPDVVWERYADIGRWTQWSPQIRSVDVAQEDIKVGLEGAVVTFAGMRIPFVITEVGIRQWTWEARPLGVPIVLEHRVAPHRDGVATELRMRGPAPVVVAYAPLAFLALRRLVSW